MQPSNWLTVNYICSKFTTFAFIFDESPDSCQPYSVIFTQLAVNKLQIVANSTTNESREARWTIEK